MVQMATAIIGWMADDMGMVITIIGPMPPPNEKPQNKWNRMRLDNEWCAKLVSLAPGRIIDLSKKSGD